MATAYTFLFAFFGAGLGSALGSAFLTSWLSHHYAEKRARNERRQTDLRERSEALQRARHILMRDVNDEWLYPARFSEPDWIIRVEERQFELLDLQMKTTGKAERAAVTDVWNFHTLVWLKAFENPSLISDAAKLGERVEKLDKTLLMLGDNIKGQMDLLP